MKTKGFREQVRLPTPGQQGVIADMIEAGAEMTRQAYAAFAFHEPYEELGFELLGDIPH
jgi:hypothetical protein